MFFGQRLLCSELTINVDSGNAFLLPLNKAEETHKNKENRNYQDTSALQA